MTTVKENKRAHRKLRQLEWWAIYRQLRDTFHYEPGRARYYARMKVDKDLAKYRVTG